MAFPFSHRNAIKINHTEFPSLPSKKQPGSAKPTTGMEQSPMPYSNIQGNTACGPKPASSTARPIWPSSQNSKKAPPKATRDVPKLPKQSNWSSTSKPSPTPETARASKPAFPPAQETLHFHSFPPHKPSPSQATNVLQPLNAPSPWATPAKLPYLLRLPVEIHRDITDLLSQDPFLLPSLIHLRLTNRYFHSLIPAPTHAQLLLMEQLPWARGSPLRARPSLYACRYCLRLRSSAHFADAMLKGRTGLNGKEPQKRFCVDCGLKSRAGDTRYSPGAEFVVGGERRVWCKICIEVKKGAEAVGCTGCCKECHEKWVCGCRGEGRLQGTPKVKRAKRRVGGWSRLSYGYGIDDDTWRDGYDDGWGEESAADYGYDEHFWECYDPSGY
ncbi:hypothetical protein BCR34DRAFT_564958 [Clohesyomyces aquaticus]|uniref:F-box domain-containing protein n=1 Tax=Clohesyomyces aquaticus TaxID=1231657 RepID=A0A1Y1ZMY8_9PLEO|nr:hypothetical protein BCR34DRAFT_564958 [Clohesyomyces aquaticus]